jgi:hypothetical protein
MPLNQLRSFLAGYFHEDWRLDGSSDSEIVRHFLSTSPTDHTLVVRQELVSLIRAGLSDHELRHLIHDEWMVCYDPSPGGRSMREWLRDLLHHMSR